MSARFSETFLVSEIFSEGVLAGAAEPNAVLICGKMSRWNSKRRFSARRPTLRFAATRLVRTAVGRARLPARLPSPVDRAGDVARFVTSRDFSAWLGLALRVRVRAA